MSSKLIQSQLNDLADKGVSGTIHNASFGWSTIMRYEPLLHSIAEGQGGVTTMKKWVADGKCYVFEIGINSGDVFSVNMVKSIEITDTGAIIHLKG